MEYRMLFFHLDIFAFDHRICFTDDHEIAMLTLIGMRQGTFTPLSFLDWILSAEFLSKISKLFWRWKLTSIRFIWHPTKLIESLKTCPIGGPKMNIFLASCQLGLNAEFYIPSTLNTDFNCVCSKILNHGLLFSLFILKHSKINLKIQD